MNDDDRRLLRDFGDRLSPTLDDNYELIKEMDRVPVCVACPMAQWYKLETPPLKPGLAASPTAAPKPPRLECFCTAYRSVMFDGGRVVTACDAFKDALDKQDGAASPNG